MLARFLLSTCLKRKAHQPYWSPLVPPLTAPSLQTPDPVILLTEQWFRRLHSLLLLNGIYFQHHDRLPKVKQQPVWVETIIIKSGICSFSPAKELAFWMFSKLNSLPDWLIFETALAHKPSRLWLTFLRNGKSSNALDNLAKTKDKQLTKAHCLELIFLKVNEFLRREGLMHNDARLIVNTCSSRFSWVFVPLIKLFFNDSISSTNSC